MTRTSSRPARFRALTGRAASLVLVVLAAAAGPCAAAVAAEKPPLAPDAVPSFTTDSRISAVVEFGLPTLAAEIEREVPRRLASIDERVNCVHRRVLFFRVNANCDIWGHVDRVGSISLYGRGGEVYGSVRIHGEIEGQGANRFTSRIHGDTEASATVEIEARPRLGRDWSVDLNVHDGFHWSEPPVLHVLGRSISIASRAEPRIRSELVRVAERAREAARRLDPRDKAATAWRHAFEPVQLFDNPEVWLQMTPHTAAFAGVGADARVIWGSLELTGSAETFVGQHPPIVSPTPLPPLGADVSQPGSFDVILPIRVGYDTIKDNILRAAALIPAGTGLSVKDTDVYPSSGKLVVGLRVAKTTDADAAAGQWVYLSAGVHADADGHVVKLSDIAAIADDPQIAAMVDPLIAQFRDNMNIDYGAAYQDFLKSVDAKLSRPLKDGFRSEGHLTTVKLEKTVLSADGVIIALRGSGGLRILYGM